MIATVRARKAIALAALLTLGGLVLATDVRQPAGGYRRAALAVWLLLLPLAAAIWGLVRDRYWGRWGALAIGLAVLPWAAALTLGPTYGRPVTRAALALAASTLLLASGVGREMFERFEGRDDRLDWRARRMGLVRWTVICNLASILSLYVFVAAYESAVGWHVAPMAALLIGLVLGVLLLANQRTVGLLLVALCCFAFLPIGVEFVLREAAGEGEAILFAVIFAPGLVTGWATLVAFSRPLWAALRAD